SLMGMVVASQVILAKLDDRDIASRQMLEPGLFEAEKSHDLPIISTPYVYIGIVIPLVFILILVKRMPDSHSVDEKDMPLKPTFARLLSSSIYREGVIAQTVYVGAQIMCWTFIIHYGTEVFMSAGMAEKDAQVLSQQ